MHCIDETALACRPATPPSRDGHGRRAAALAAGVALSAAGWLAGCAQSGAPTPAMAAPGPTVAGTGGPAPGPARVPTAGAAGNSAPVVADKAAAGAKPAGGPRPMALPAPTAARNKDDLRKQAARRLVAAHPEHSYMGKPPQILLAVPVLEVELNADGSVKQVKVLRQPSQAKDTTQLAVDAIHRAAPYGDVSKLPKPWTFVESFLFDDNRKFKPRTLDE